MSDKSRGLGRTHLPILWWECPQCQSKVNYSYQLISLFDHEDGESLFPAEDGVPIHTIKCGNAECQAEWVMGISPVLLPKSVK